jgi:lipoyl(octanoyl) transferase
MNGTDRILTSSWLGTVDYRAALALQDAMAAARRLDLIGDTILMLEHPPVYTLGRGADERFMAGAPADVPVFRVSRGGQVTFHGPGQLIVYPILKLEGASRDVMRYLRMLEESAIDALARCGIDSGRRAGLTGVWIGDRKIASIGVGLRRWITLHGIALNVSTDLGYFERIVPCGIAGCEMTSIARLGHPEISVVAAAEAMSAAFVRTFGYERFEEVPASALWRLVHSSFEAPDFKSERAINGQAAKTFGALR